MKKFVEQLLVFMLPFYVAVIAIGICYFMGYEIGELCDYNKLIERQREDPSIFIGMGYNEQTEYYKIVNANYYQTDVIALGTSRVMQFKSDYFLEDFYNCGGAVSGNYDEYLNFLQNLNYDPKVILLGLDTWVFNDEWNKSCLEYSAYTPLEMKNRGTLSIMKAMVQDFVDGKWSLRDIRRYNMNYGFNGRIKDEGFQWDGSYYYGNLYRNPKESPDYMFADTLDRVTKGYGRFEWGSAIDDETCEYLEALLKYCKQKDIEVIGFAPPLAPGIYSKMIESGNYDYLYEIEPACEKVFEKYDYLYADYTNGAVLGVDDTYFLDGFHGSEVVYAYIINDLYIRDSKLNEYVDKEKLDTLLADYYDNWQLKDFVHK
ncbi:MAG: hypothetical protein NC331_00450 [Lachnospiraceae bacterium]|nr:hypothetical protein [Lachnospiraceae bacterium]MCM1237837.1 hypothetical protein [Lachnospiraceae bacterium]